VNRAATSKGLVWNPLHAWVDSINIQWRERRAHANAFRVE